MSRVYFFLGERVRKWWDICLYGNYEVGIEWYKKEIFRD